MNNTEKFHLAVKKIECAQSTLQTIVDALITVGNEHLATKMFKLVSEIDRAVEDIRDVVNDNNTELFKMAQQGTANMLNGVLAGIKLGTDK